MRLWAELDFCSLSGQSQSLIKVHCLHEQQFQHWNCSLNFSISICLSRVRRIETAVSSVQRLLSVSPPRPCPYCQWFLQWGYWKKISRLSDVCLFVLSTLFHTSFSPVLISPYNNKNGQVILGLTVICRHQKVSNCHTACIVLIILLYQLISIIILQIYHKRYATENNNKKCVPSFALTLSIKLSASLLWPFS